MDLKLLFGQSEILFHHLAADGVVEVAVLLKGLQSQVTIDLVQGSEESSDKLHAADLAQKLGDTGIGTCVLGTHCNLVVRRLELGILAGHKAVGFT